MFFIREMGKEDVECVCVCVYIYMFMYIYVEYYSILLNIIHSQKRLK